MEQNIVIFIFNEETKKWQIINGAGITSKITMSEETGRERLLEYCQHFPSLNLVKNEQRILLKYDYRIVGKVEYLSKKQEISLIQFLYDILFVLQKERRDMQIVPGFHQQEDGVQMTILKNAVVLNNVFGENNLLSEEEQEFFLKSFQNFNDYYDLLHSNFRRMLKNVTK